MKKLLLKTMLLLCALIVGGASSVWAQSDMSAVYTSNVTLPSSGTNVSSCSVTISGNSYTGTKLGKSGAGASATFTAPIGTKYIHIHIAAWKDKSSTLTVKNGSTTLLNAASLTSDSGIANTSPFTLSAAAKATTDYYKVITLPTALAAAATITIQANSERAVFWGVNTEVAAVAISSIAFDEPKTASVDVGSTVTLTPTVLPVGYTEAVDWVSDATGVATVSSTGVVTGVAAGTAHITAKAHDNPSTIYDVCTVTVTNVAVKGVSLKASTTIEKGKTETLTPTFDPTNATNKNVTWFSNATGVATVDEDGVVTAVSAGTANITVTTEDGGKTATCVVTVVNEKGTSDAPFSVAEVIDGTGTGSDKYVVGYIVGSYKSGSKSNFGRNGDANTNLAIADDPDEDDVDNTVAVQLPAGSIRTNFNVEDNPHFIGSAKILIKADITSYITSTGLKNTDEMSKLAEIVKISDASGFATYASDSPLDFTDKDIDAYIAVTKGDGTGVTFSQVNKVPANTGLLIHYSGAKTEEIPVFDGTGAETVTSNKFVKGTGATVATDGTTVWNYILNKVGGNIGFYKANGQTVAKNRAYISILQSETPASVKDFFTIDFDEFDGIRSMDNGQLTMDNERTYRLDGTRVNGKITKKGLYIRGGRKVVVR